MRGVQNTYGDPGYACNRKPYGVSSSALTRQCFPLAVRFIPTGVAFCFAHSRVHTNPRFRGRSADMEARNYAEQLKLQQLPALFSASTAITSADSFAGVQRQLK